MSVGAGVRLGASVGIAVGSRVEFSVGNETGVNVGATTGEQLARRTVPIQSTDNRLLMVAPLRIVARRASCFGRSSSPALNRKL